MRRLTLSDVSKIILNDTLYLLTLCRVSGVTDHYAVSDEHALTIARSIVANLNWTEGTKSYVSNDYDIGVSQNKVSYVLCLLISLNRLHITQ